MKSTVASLFLSFLAFTACVSCTTDEKDIMESTDEAIKPCRDCFGCVGKRNYVWRDDDFGELYTKVTDADCIIIGSPTYSADVSYN